MVAGRQTSKFQKRTAVRTERARIEEQKMNLQKDAGKLLPDCAAWEQLSVPGVLEAVSERLQKEEKEAAFALPLFFIMCHRDAASDTLNSSLVGTCVLGYDKKNVYLLWEKSGNEK